MSAADEPRRLSERRARTRDEILDAAAALINEHGCEEFSLGELAERSGFGNAASLYRYFDGRQAIFAALSERSLERLAEHMRRVPTDLPPREQLVEIAVTYLDYAHHHPGEGKLLMTVGTRSKTDYRDGQPRAEFVERVFCLLSKAAEDGVFVARDEDDLFAILHAGWALAQGLIEYDLVYSGRERQILRERHRGILRAYVLGFTCDWPNEEKE